MQAIDRVVSVYDYVDAVRPTDVVVAPWPCQGCDYYDHCKRTGEECVAWRAYNKNAHFAVPTWDPADRVPRSIATAEQLSKLIERHAPARPKIEHDGHQFILGSLRERVYLIVRDRGVASYADVASALGECEFSRANVRTTMRRMHADNLLLRLPDQLWALAR